MVKCKHTTVEEILAKVNDDKKLVAERLRALVKGLFPQATEMVRQERITFTLNGKDFSGIRITKQHVDLLFLHSASISSPQLKGQGTVGDPKHLEVYAMKNFDETEARRLLKEAAAGVLAA
jgi:hypothetical protein